MLGFIDVMNLDVAFFFFNDTATTEIYTLSLHDALPISHFLQRIHSATFSGPPRESGRKPRPSRDRKSTRLNSSHSQISYAVFCLKKTPCEDRLTRHQSPAGRNGLDCVRVRPLPAHLEYL